MTDPEVEIVSPPEADKPVEAIPTMPVEPEQSVAVVPPPSGPPVLEPVTPPVETEAPVIN